MAEETARPSGVSSSARAPEAAPLPEPIFVADSFGKAFGTTEVLRAATCWARPGRITVLLGRNGSGKSTLIRAALGLLRADHGVVRWDGEPMLRPRLARLSSRGLFFVPDRELLSRKLRVRDHFGALRSRYPEAWTLDEWDPLAVAGFRDRRARELSGGERRRIELTLGLLRNPRCLIADEPFVGIAPLDQERCAAAYREAAARGTAILATGHEVDRLLDLADDVIWIVAGGTYGLGTPAEARVHYQFRREYLGSRGARRPEADGR